jgi:predicted transcriptional regulator
MVLKKPQETGWSRRERQIMDILFRRGEATAAEVRDDMPSAPGYSAVRAMLRVLEEKGQVRHAERGPRYVYAPTVARENAKRSAVEHLLDTFFGGSAEQTMAALLDVSSSHLTAEELDRMAALIARARKEGS